MTENNRVLVTGAAGFIGFHLSKLLLKHGFDVTGLDVINHYYDPQVKYDRLAHLGIAKDKIANYTYTDGVAGFRFIQLALEDREGMKSVFADGRYDYVVHLAAQAGVRYSLENPYTYIDSNISGFLNIIEGCRHNPVKHLVYASSSSVYGLNKEQPFSVDHNVDHPISLYAASKKANELMAHTYSYLYNIPTSGLRFFTVYGPWGRPDMALFIFTKAILEGKPMQVFNHGNMQRDFTYVDDIVESIRRLIPAAPKGNPDFKGAGDSPATSPAPYTVYNIGNNSPVKLMDFIRMIEENTGKKAQMDLQPMQPGDVPSTYADVASLFDAIDFRPQTRLEDGVRNFVEWYREYYKV